jgi:hypothetical protein
MSRRIIVEAFFVVLGLRWDELRGRGPKRPPENRLPNASFRWMRSAA